jgi:hypothetical protein
VSVAWATFWDHDHLLRNDHKLRLKLLFLSPTVSLIVHCLNWPLPIVYCLQNCTVLPWYYNWLILLPLCFYYLQNYFLIGLQLHGRFFRIQIAQRFSYLLSQWAFTLLQRSLFTSICMHLRSWIITATIEILDGYLVVRDIVIDDCVRRLLFLIVLVLLLWFIFNVWFQHF